MITRQEMNGESDQTDESRQAPAVQVEVEESPALTVAGTPQLSELVPNLARHGGHPAEGCQEEILDEEANSLTKCGVIPLQFLSTQQGNYQLRREKVC